MANLDDIFIAMGTALPSSRFPEKTVLMIVDGVKYFVDGIEKTAIKGEGQRKPDLQITTSFDTLKQLLEKKLTPQQAFMKRLLKIKGNMGLAMKLTILVNATRKQLQKQSQSRL